MPPSKRKTIAEKLTSIVSKEASKIPDFRKKVSQGAIPLHDAVMSGLAMMHLKYPSLLQFDRDCVKTPAKLHNLKSMYGVTQVPSDTYFREMLDPIETRYLRKFFTLLFAFVQRSGRLRHFEYFDEGYLAPIDGTGHFCSGKIHCPECCVKKPGSKNPQYYHQLLACCLVKPGKKEVLPLMPEPIIQQQDASKNDCEKTALKRLLANLSREHPHLKLVLNFDDLYSDGPTIKLVQSYGYSFIMVAKDTSHVSLYESVDELDKAGKVKRYYYADENGYQHWFRFVNGVSINKSHKETLVNYLEYVETDPKGNKYVNTWITDIQLTEENVAKVMRGGRARWKIENETFNTLKTQGYHLEHNYGHGKQHLATNLASLTFTAFLINQIEQLACKFFQQALEAKKSKKALWLAIRGLFDWFTIDNWEDLFTAIIEGRSVSLKHLVIDTT
ncbi:transposase [uncultured Endozoicomonas sp.]|uniref:transposase n=1 Tax=uncultured Endozoicomonas sp. TaxID=432652 RepID=UPI00261AA410|nr:transposase [uncultured Endozoicomonas sp.]